MKPLKISKTFVKQQGSKNFWSINNQIAKRTTKPPFITTFDHYTKKYNDADCQEYGLGE
jgi:hypothetical protein